MNGLIALPIAYVVATLGMGVWLAMQPQKSPPAWMKHGLVANLALFALTLAVTLLFGVDHAMAAEPIVAANGEVSLGKALALLAVGLPTAVAALAAAMALGNIGSAGLAVLAEKPELFGRTLVYMGLAEGIAIYGLVMSILMLDKL